MTVSSEQQSMKGLSHIYTWVHSPQTPLPSRLPHNIKHRQFHVLYNRSLLVIHFKYSSVYVTFPKSLTIPSLPPTVSFLGNTIFLEHIFPVHISKLFFYDYLFSSCLFCLRIWYSWRCPAVYPFTESETQVPVGPGQMTASSFKTNSEGLIWKRIFLFSTSFWDEVE